MFEKIAPKSGTPIVPPIERKSVAVEVATPRFSYSTAFWTASTSTCITNPRPNPTTSMYRSARSKLVPTPSRESSSRPTTISAVPMIGNSL